MNDLMCLVKFRAMPPSSASEVGFVSRFVLQDEERARLTQLRAQRLWPFVDFRQHSKWQETIARRRVSKDALFADRFCAMGPGH